MNDFVSLLLSSINGVTTAIETAVLDSVKLVVNVKTLDLENVIDFEKLSD